MTHTKHTLPKGVWIEHTPGECPVPDGTWIMVWVKDEGPSQLWWKSEAWREEFQGGKVTSFMIKPDEDTPDELTRLRAQNAALVEASKTFLSRYVELVNGGDCGNWDPEKEPEVIAMRAALAQAESDQ